MPVPFRLRLPPQSQSSPDYYVGQFCDPDWRTLREFVQCVEALTQTEFIRNARGPGGLRWDTDHGWSVAFTAPDSEVREFLHVFRPILLERERTSFVSIVRILRRAITHEFVRQRIRYLRDHFNLKHSLASFRFTTGDLTLNSDRALKLWLNALEYHRDIEKQHKLTEALGTMPLEVAKCMFFVGLLDKVRAASVLAGLVRAVEATPPDLA